MSENLPLRNLNRKILRLLVRELADGLTPPAGGEPILNLPPLLSPLKETLKGYSPILATLFRLKVEQKYLEWKFALKEPCGQREVKVIPVVSGLAFPLVEEEDIKVALALRNNLPDHIAPLAGEFVAELNLLEELARLREKTFPRLLAVELNGLFEGLAADPSPTAAEFEKKALPIVERATRRAVKKLITLLPVKTPEQKLLKWFLLEKLDTSEVEKEIKKAFLKLFREDYLPLLTEDWEGEEEIFI
jgi:hypothetical protein